MKKFWQLVVPMLVFASVSSTALAIDNPYVYLHIVTYYEGQPQNTGAAIVIELYPDMAPVTVDNFLGYVNSGFYNNILFHRAIPNFMIQAGLCYPGSEYPIIATPGDPIVNEGDNGLRNVRGTISTALSNYADSATSQFFINQVDNPHLDYDYPDGNGYGHCVFGEVVQGMNNVDIIAQWSTYDYSSLWGPAFMDFPDGPMVGIGAAIVRPCYWSHCMDFSGDSWIGLEDFAVFASHWLDECGSANDFCDGKDLNYDGIINISDLGFFSDHWERAAGHEPGYSDLVYDYRIDFDDFSALMMHWLDSGCNEDNNYCNRADIDHSGTVDMVDYSLLASHWLEDYH